ncbi:MFS transporter [Xenorhabdus bovienii]|uniref:MFS transporter n=1 Tax=Xenorhabdus bovienii TaxID=40576 RepID=UPI0023B291E1|nr:MFS transporter [Xenorhabdus bovienii]MDE9495820.1 MFS transporter [Xenorhabdus bovienii]MDE9504213.1 MFS transporter [Xenorhabdus bovienii]MDE9527920.1 MFS transporter [Xenorhabdus bovienii]MDE9571115.1 MFS transporter [Xenorhabdus bovienii]
MTSDFWKICYAESIYILSSRILIAIITLYFLNSDSVWLSSCFLFFYFTSKSVFGIFLAHKFEKLEKKRILTQLILLFIGVSLLTIIVKSTSVSSLIFIFISVGIGFVDSFFTPVVNAFIPAIVDNILIDEAFRKIFLIQALNNLFGIAIGMAGYGSIGFTNMIWVIIVSALISLIILISLNNKGRSFSSSEEKISGNNIKNSMAIFISYRFEPWWAFFSMIINMFLAPFSSFVIPYFIVNVAGNNPIMIGLIEGCAAAGAIFSSYYFQKKIELVIGRAQSVIFSFWTIGLCFLLLSFINHIFIWSILTFIMGIAIVMNNVSVESCRSVAIPEKNRVKVQTIHNAFIGAGNPLGLLFTPFIIKNYGCMTALIISAVIIVIAAVFVRFIPLFHELLTCRQEDISNLYEKKYGDL